ncbi:MULTISPECIES: glycosyltransferase [unclassified Thermomonas]|uniref:glycosyltransferase n=1 Tax=unclassified Thermomonas TaxID=2633315 RepID=UPI001CC21A27|nr:glycosyltransferase [Thermomonas sp. XSG]
MRIIFFTPQLSSGGAQQVAILLSSAMASLGHEVTIAPPSLAGELASKVNRHCSLFDLKSSKPIKARRNLAALVNELNPDAVICFGIYTGIAAALSSLSWRNTPALVIRNENNLHIDWQQGTWLNRIIGPHLSRWAARKAHVIAVSQSLAQPTADFLRIPSSRLTTILNPVIDDSAPQITGTEETLHPWLRDKSVPTFVAMGRLEHQKGFDVLIDAFSRARKRTDARLIIFGKGALRDTLQNQIASCGMNESICLAGFTPHAISQMSAAHAFVLSSRFEGFGLVLVEAMLAGTKVISTSCDFGPSELLEDGRYGKLVPVDDAQALADAILQSIKEPWTAERPSEQWFSQFTASEAARQHLALIEKLRSDSGNFS